MTQLKKDTLPKKKNREALPSSKQSVQSSKQNAKQPELPLSKEHIKGKSEENFPKSKIIFQIKSELHRLQQRDREWKLMFNMLSHDLKEPLLTLEGFTKLLDGSGLETKDQKRYLKVIREAVNSLHLLVGSLQSISKLHQEPQELSDICLKDLLSSVVLSLSEQIQRNNGEIRIPEEKIIVRSDPVRLFQVFLNIFSNSLKYHRNSVPPVISLKYRRDSQYHRIAITDNGVGIDSDDLKRIFVPFTRLEDVPTDGMGIGLSIVKRIAESFGGKVLVRSKQNVGTTFTVCLPRIEKAEKE